MYCTYHVLYVLRAVYVLRTMYCTYCVPRTVRTAYHVLYALRAACVLRYTACRGTPGGGGGGGLRPERDGERAQGGDVGETWMARYPRPRRERPGNER